MTGKNIQITDKVKSDLKTRFVYLRGSQKVTIPLEERITRPDGSVTRNVSTCDYDNAGRKINTHTVRNIELGDTGWEQYDPTVPEDADFLERLLPWLESGDPRIDKYDLEIVDNERDGVQPIDMYDRMKPEALVQRITENVDLLGEDEAGVRDLLERCAEYELNRKYPVSHEKAGEPIPPRRKILDAIDEIGQASGVEYADDEVVVA